MNKTMPISLSRCMHCGACWTLKPYACATCGGVKFVQTNASGYGKVKANSVVHRAPDDAWRPFVPYTLVLVTLDEGPTIMGHAQGCLQIGDAVAAHRIFKGDMQVLAFERINLDGQG